MSKNNISDINADLLKSVKIRMGIIHTDIDDELKSHISMVISFSKTVWSYFDLSDEVVKKYIIEKVIYRFNEKSELNSTIILDCVSYLKVKENETK